MTSSITEHSFSTCASTTHHLLSFPPFFPSLFLSIPPSLHLSISPSLHLSISPTLHLSLSSSLPPSNSPSLLLSTSPPLSLPPSLLLSTSLHAPVRAFPVHVGPALANDLVQALALPMVFQLRRILLDFDIAALGDLTDLSPDAMASKAVALARAVQTATSELLGVALPQIGSKLLAAVTECAPVEVQLELAQQVTSVLVFWSYVCGAVVLLVVVVVMMISSCLFIHHPCNSCRCCYS